MADSQVRAVRDLVLRATVMFVVMIVVTAVFNLAVHRQVRVCWDVVIIMTVVNTLLLSYLVRGKDDSSES